jgi:multiple sugar transport system substrate-binding protein
MNRRRRRGALAAVSLAAAALTVVSACSPGSPPLGIAPAGETASGSIEFWHFFTDREADALQQLVDDFEAKYPQIKVIVKSGQDDDKMTQAIGAGNGPDVGLSFSTDIVGKFCASGAWRDLAGYISRDGVDLDDIPGPVQQYTAFRGRRCTMPLLADAYGLFYNKRMFAAAGIANPPRTFRELTEDAERLTRFNPDGSIRVAGFDPLYGFYENSAAHFAALVGAHWLTNDSTSAIGGDRAWRSLLTWQRGLIDFYGADKLTRFQAGFGDEFGADNAFEKGQVAMNMDGEYRLASIAADAPADLDYGVAPMPVADEKADLYGAGYITGNVIGISKGSKNPEAAWQFIRYLTTDTGAVVKLANGIRNIPTTNPALRSPDLNTDANFTVFLRIFTNPNSSTTPPSCCGTAYQDAMQTFLNDWQSGGIGDLPGALRGVDNQINLQLGLGG